VPTHEVGVWTDVKRMARSFDATQVECTIFTFKDGVMQRLAHDLKLRVANLQVEVDGEAAVHASFDAASVTTVVARKDGKDDPQGVSDSDKKTIDEIIKKDVLAVTSSPVIRFTSSKVTREADGYSVVGALTLKSKTKDVTFHARREGGKYVAELDLDQRDFDIKPYSAMLGTLRIQPVLKVRIELPA